MRSATFTALARFDAGSPDGLLVALAARVDDGAVVVRSWPRGHRQGLHVIQWRSDGRARRWRGRVYGSPYNEPWRKRAGNAAKVAPTGWGEPMRRRPGDALADAVRAFLMAPTTTNRERMAAALNDHEDRQ